MKHGSLFDGIGGFSLPCESYDMTTLWASEIDNNCISLTRNKFKYKHYGDITLINDVEAVDIITFGSPCNNLSLCGNKKGFDGECSKLFFDAIRIIDNMRSKTNGQHPKFIVWENVSGSFSSNKGEDFRTVIKEITKEDIPMPGFNKWSKAGMVRSNRCNVEWRTFNSKYFGVPQSRDRVILVADFRANRSDSGEILFEREGDKWDCETFKRNRCEFVKSHEKYTRCLGDGGFITSTIFASYGTKWNGNSGAYTGKHFVDENGRLRRLTPKECERLFGFPDDWTYGFKDTIRYRMVGNSVCIPMVEFVYDRIRKCI